MLGSVFKETGARPLLEVPLEGTLLCATGIGSAGSITCRGCCRSPFPIAALAAARAFYWIDDQDPGLAKRFARRVFATYFGNGRNVSPPEVVADIAEGLDVDRPRCSPSSTTRSGSSG